MFIINIEYYDAIRDWIFSFNSNFIKEKDEG